MNFNGLTFNVNNDVESPGRNIGFIKLFRDAVTFSSKALNPASDYDIGSEDFVTAKIAEILNAKIEYGKVMGVSRDTRVTAYRVQDWHYNFVVDGLNFPFLKLTYGDFSLRSRPVMTWAHQDACSKWSSNRVMSPAFRGKSNAKKVDWLLNKVVIKALEACPEARIHNTTNTLRDSINGMKCFLVDTGVKILHTGKNPFRYIYNPEELVDRAYKGGEISIDRERGEVTFKGNMAEGFTRYYDEIVMNNELIDKDIIMMETSTRPDGSPQIEVNLYPDNGKEEIVALGAAEIKTYDLYEKVSVLETLGAGVFLMGCGLKFNDNIYILTP